MKSYTITLTSVQTLGVPDLLNHYIFSDPVFGVNFTYPSTVDGGPFSPSYTYSSFVSGGLYYPWGYIFQNTLHTINLPPLKGPYTVYFSPTALDTRYYGVLKIFYDFGDGESQNVERDVVPNNPDTALTDGDPAEIVISHNYWPKNNQSTTYYPTITVLNGNLALDVYNIKLTITPASVFELGDKVRLLNVAQHAQSLDETLGVFEIERPDKYVTNARFFSGADTLYNINLRSFDFSSLSNPFNPNESSLILNLDAQDALTVGKDSQNKMVYWYDKSPKNNDFYQPDPTKRPLYQYSGETQSGRKAVKFTPNKILKSINTTGFSSITGGYTLCFVLKANSRVGTIFTSLSSDELPTLIDSEVSQVLMYNRPLEQNELELVKQGLRLRWDIN